MYFFIRINNKFCIISGYINDISLIISDVKHRIASSQAASQTLRDACPPSAAIARVNSSHLRFCFGNSFQTHVGIFRQHVVFFFDMSYTEIIAKTQNNTQKTVLQSANYKEPMEGVPEYDKNL